MQVLIAYPFKSEICNRDQLIYLPELVQNEPSLRGAIRQHRPHVIIVGNNSVESETLDLWRAIMSYDVQLTLIRRGSSLSRINVRRAKQLNINVLNTLRYVCKSHDQRGKQKISSKLLRITTEENKIR